MQEHPQYNPEAIEAKWQKKWADSGVFNARFPSDKPKYYCLIEFPYPSGNGLHVGHPRSNTALQLGQASKVVPIDKLSVVITLILAWVFLHEQFNMKSLIGAALIAAGTLVMVL